jgi:hypothetical protein
VLGELYAEDSAAHSGLNFGYKSGVVRNDNVISTTAAGTILLVDNDVNFVEVTPSTGTITTNTTGFTSLRVPLFEVTTSSGAIQTPATDRRTWAALGGGGGGGGHAQNTDIGTDSAEFKLLNTVVGAPTSNGSFKVERGSSNDVDVRWNETTDIWEFTNDGVVYNPLGAPDLGQQELSKFVMLENPPAVVDDTSRGDSPGGTYQQVDLTLTAPFSSIPNGVQGMLLRVQFDDSTPSSSTTVLIRKIEDALHSPTESMRVFARDSADVDDQEGSIIVTPGMGLDVSDNIKIGFEYLVDASGATSANLKIFVLGYWEKVTGVGTQNVTFVGDTGSIALDTLATLNLTGFANRALIHSVSWNTIAGTPTTAYDVKFYGKDTHLAADLQYQLDNVDPTAGPPNVTDTLPFFYEDLDGTSELHLTVDNNDLAQAGTFEVTIKMEKFA